MAKFENGVFICLCARLFVYLQSRRNSSAAVVEMDAYTIYFADVSVVITSQPLPPAYSVMECDGGLRISRANIVKKAETEKYIAVRTPDADRTMASLAAQFVQVEAAGGVAVDAAGRKLMIHRNGRWDLPKGHREAGESVAECAVRETEEETGVRIAEVGELLCTTVHCYNLYGRWEMKHTSWFLMRAAEGGGMLRPQGEEGIVAAEWVGDEEVPHRIKMSFPTIREVFRALYEKEGRPDAAECKNAELYGKDTLGGR